MIEDKNILINGGNSGIGLFAIINLLKTKNNLYILIKSELRKKKFLSIIKKYYDESHISRYLIFIENCDLSDLKNIKKIKDYFDSKKIFLEQIITSALRIIYFIQYL